MITPFDLIQGLSSWFFRKGEAIFTGGKDINTGGGDVIVGAGFVDGVDLTAHVADVDAHHNQQHAIDGGDHTGQLDHGADLAGLGDDDHTQYHNDSRGDARYFQESEFSDNPGSSSKPLESDSSGDLTLNALTVTTTGVSIDASGSIKIGTSGVLSLFERGTPSNPSSGQLFVYAKTDGKLYYKNDAGTEFEVVTV